MTVLAGRKETRLNKDTRQFTTPGCSFSSTDSGNTSAAAGFRCGSLLRRTLLRQRGRCTRRIQWQFIASDPRAAATAAEVFDPKQS